MISETLPTISIGIPTYNSSKHIAETLESIEAQDYINIEVIICDNCSQDNTALLIKKYAEKSKFKYHININKKNIGAASNFRETLKFAKTELFMWLGSHDLMEPNCISILIDLYLKNDNCFISSSHYTVNYSERNNLEKIPAKFHKLFNLDTRNLKYLDHIKTIIRYPHAGSRMYGVFPVKIKKYFLPIKVLYWDTLFLSRLHLLMRVKLVDELLWTRRDTPNPKESTSQAILRQLNFIYGTDKGLSFKLMLSIPIHLIVLFKDVIILNLLGVKNSPKIKDIPNILKNHLIRINPVRLFKAFKFSIKQAILNKHL